MPKNWGAARWIRRLPADAPGPAQAVSPERRIKPPARACRRVCGLTKTLGDTEV